MKLQILSDTHCYDYTLDPTADLIVHAGDFGNNGMYFLLEFANKCNKILVTVPSDSLRTQLSNKFISLSLLRKFNIIDNTCYNPIVGVINK